MKKQPAVAATTRTSRVSSRHPLKKKNVHFSSGRQNWKTPPKIIRPTEAVLGVIDLDPCSPIVPNIPARRFFTEEINGLRQPWYGNVFMNPPYKSCIWWIKKILREYRAGRVKEAIILVAARTETKAFHLLRSFPMCFIKGRLKFSGSKNTATFPSVAIYLGPNARKFHQEFKHLGVVMLEWNPEA